MGRFHSVTLLEVAKETEDCTVLTFDVPPELREDFSYKQGQHLTLKATIKEADVRRPYSLCSSPVENKWQVAVKRIPGGLFSNYVNDALKVGDTIEVMAPSGSFFTEIEPEKSNNYVLFAAGSGITPIISIIKTLLALEPHSTIKLFYLNRETKSIIFMDEIGGLKNKYLNRFEIFHFLSREERAIPLLNGRFTKEKLQAITQTIVAVNEVDACFICGPEQMIFLIKDEMVAAGLEANKIHYELFVSGSDEAEREHIAAVKGLQATHAEVTIIESGKSFHFEMDADAHSILDAALANDADLPFACKGGVCCTCKSKLIEGSVEMKVNYALEKEDVDNGYILTCQSIPTSDKVVIDFDH